MASFLTWQRPRPVDTCGFCLLLCARGVPSGLGLLPGAPVPGQGVDTTGPEAPDAGAATSACPVFPSVGRALALSSLLLEASWEPEEGSSQKENACPRPRRASHHPSPPSSSKCSSSQYLLASTVCLVLPRAGPERGAGFLSPEQRHRCRRERVTWAWLALPAPAGTYPQARSPVVFREAVVSWGAMRVC